MTADTLAIFIEELRARLERGELAGHPAIHLDLARTFTNVEQSVRVMLADVDRYRGMSPELRNEPWNKRQRLRLAKDLRQLQRKLA